MWIDLSSSPPVKNALTGNGHDRVACGADRLCARLDRRPEALTSARCVERCRSHRIRRGRSDGPMTSHGLGKNWGSVPLAVTALTRFLRCSRLVLSGISSTRCPRDGKSLRDDLDQLSRWPAASSFNLDYLVNTPSSPELQLPRMARGRTQPKDNDPPWSKNLALLALSALLFFTISGPWMTFSNTEGQNILRQTGYGLIFIAALIAQRPWHRPERLLVMPIPIVLALGWCWLSTFWMIAPGVGIRRLALTTIVAWSIFSLIRRIDVKATLDVVRICLAITLTTNIAVIVLFPKIGVLSWRSSIFDGPWMGVMAEKNNAGAVSALTFLVFLFAPTGVKPLVRIFVCFASAVFLMFTQSKTSLGVCVIASVGAALYNLMMNTRKGDLRGFGLSYLLTGACLLIFVGLAAFPSYFLDLISDPAGFTGRTQIWSALIRAYSENPLLGVGYGSFWDLGPSGPIFKYATNWVSGVSEGHNAYLDLLVQIGVFGTLIVIYAVFAWPLERLLIGESGPARRLGVALLIFCAGHSFTESQLFDRDSLVQVFTMMSIALIWSVTESPGRIGISSRTGPHSRRSSGGPLRL